MMGKMLKLIDIVNKITFLFSTSRLNVQCACEILVFGVECREYKNFPLKYQSNIVYNNISLPLFVVNYNHDGIKKKSLSFSNYHPHNKMNDSRQNANNNFRMKISNTTCSDLYHSIE